MRSSNPENERLGGGGLGSTEEKDENWEEFFLLMRIK